jgi:hypothetical protein
MTIKAYARTLARELDRLVKLKPTSTEGRHLRDAIIVDAQDKLLVFRTRRDVESANNESERNLRPFAAPPQVARAKRVGGLAPNLCSRSGRPLRTLSDRGAGFLPGLPF